jgi:hypothetical protein
VSGVVVLLAYSRPDLLSHCLTSLYDAEGSIGTRKIIVLQPEDPDVIDLVMSRADDDTVVIHSPAHGSTPTQRMMSQFWLGMDAALAEPNCDWIMSLEEDSIISSDALVFVEDMNTRYRRNVRFMGVNLGSVETDPALRGTYSLLRYGFMGSAGALPRSHWVRARRFAARRSHRYEPLDCQIEAVLKMGFMATPNLSKCMNFGWIGGTHVTDEPPVRAHFDAMSQSWDLHDQTRPYKRRDVDHGWRHDAVPFLLRDDPRYLGLLAKSLAGRSLRSRRLGRSNSR